MRILGMAVLALILLNSCASVKIKSSRDKDLDITKSKTFSYYGWSEVNDMVEIDQKLIEKALGKELIDRGLTYVELGGDLVVSIFLVVDKESTTNRYNSYYGVGPYGYAQPGWGWGVGYSGYGYVNGYGGRGNQAGVPYKENDFYEGTLVVDIFDHASKKLAWQGVVSRVIKPEQKKRPDMAKVAAKLFEPFPIKKIEDK